MKEKKENKVNKNTKKPKEEYIAQSAETDEETKIIQAGLKSKSDKDKLCYAAMVIIFILILIPPIFRKVFYVEPPVILTVNYQTLSCRKSMFLKDGGKSTTEIHGSFKNQIVGEVYYITTYDGKTEPSEIAEFRALENPNILIEETKLEEQPAIKVTFNFEKYPALRQIEELANYTKVINQQEQYFRSKQFSCSQDGYAQKEYEDGTVIERIEEVEDV